MNLFCGNLEELFKKYQVYNVPTMGMDDFMVVSGMPNVVGKNKKKQWTQKCLIQNIQGTSMSLRLLAWRLIFLQDLWSYKSRIDQTWNSMCAWDSTGKYSDTNDKNIWHEWENITLSSRAVARRSEWWQAPSCRATASCPRRSPWPGGSRASARAWGSTSARSENMFKKLLHSNISLRTANSCWTRSGASGVTTTAPWSWGWVICEKCQYFPLILFCSVSRMRNWTHFGW